jgi:DNA-binding transcriptional ArsR family regulator
LKEIVLNSEQLACLASPTRNETFATIRSLGKASVRELADRMGRSPEALYYHVKALSKAGLIKEALRRPTVRKPEAVYESVEANYRLPQSGSDPELDALARRSVVSGLRHTIRGYETASTIAEKDVQKRPYLQVIRVACRLSEEHAKSFFELIEEAARFAKDHEQPDGVRLHWSSVVFPEK